MRSPLSSPSRHAHRQSACLVAAIIGAVVLSAVTSISDEARAGASTSSSIALLSQTNWVGPGSDFALSLSLNAPLPSDQLALTISLYSRSTSTSAFRSSLAKGGIIGEVPLSTTRTISVGSTKAPTTNNVDVALRVTIDNATPRRASTSPALSLNCSPAYCSGVYPLQIALIDRTKGTPLATVVTHLVYLATAANLTPLQVGIVLPLGATPELDATGRSLLSASDIASLQRVVGILDTHRDVPLSLQLYPQLLVALRRTQDAPRGARAISSLKHLLAPSAQGLPPELIRTGFVPLAIDALDPSIQDNELNAQFARAAQTLAGVLGPETTVPIYVSSTPIDTSSIAALHGAGVDHLVVDPANVQTPPFELTETAPFVLETPGQGSSSPTAFPAETNLGQLFADSNSQPVLQAHRLLAELAQIYFEQPSTSARAVVIAPGQWAANPVFLVTLLNGLRALPAVNAEDLSSLFATIAIGANDNPTNASLTANPTATQIGISKLESARHDEQIVASVVPGDLALQQRLNDSTLLAEAPLSDHARAAYLDAARVTLRGLGSSLSVLSGRSITLTSRTGRLPITIRTTGIRPMNVILRLSSADLEFPNSGGARPIVLRQRDTSRLLNLSSRTSGAFSLRLTLLSPEGGYVLTESRLTVRSTAISGVAIALSIAAAAVLGAWWLRSVRRHRRNKRTPTVPVAAE